MTRGNKLSWRGVFTVLVTPFHDDLSIDFTSFEKQIEFCLACNVQGIVAPVIAGEFFTLSDAERIRLIQTAVQVIDGKVPFVAGVSGVSAPHAVSLAKAAAEAGADALVAMPPYVPAAVLDAEKSLRYYEALGKATPLPLMVQNAPAPWGFPLSTAQLVGLLEHVPSTEVIKEETMPNPQKLGALVAASQGKLEAVFGGLGGIYLLNELSRGAAGTMPACEFADVVVQIFEQLGSGNEAEARAIFTALQPALVMERLYNMTFMKACLKRRGVLKNTVTRVAEPPLDNFDERELEAIWERLSPFFRV
jgi:dihydrodipicolinate synthase/N-acetylneuraminate lyase